MLDVQMFDLTVLRFQIYLYTILQTICNVFILVNVTIAHS